MINKKRSLNGIFSGIINVVFELIKNTLETLVENISLSFRRMIPFRLKKSLFLASIGSMHLLDSLGQNQLIIFANNENTRNGTILNEINRFQFEDVEIESVFDLTGHIFESQRNNKSGKTQFLIGHILDHDFNVRKRRIQNHTAEKN